MASDEFIKEERRWESVQQDRADKEAARRRESRNQWIGYVATATVACVIVIVIGLVIWHWRTTVSASQTRIINACTEQGMTWMTLGGVNGEKVCVKMVMELPK